MAFDVAIAGKARNSPSPFQASIMRDASMSAAPVFPEPIASSMITSTGPSGRPIRLTCCCTGRGNVSFGRMASNEFSRQAVVSLQRHEAQLGMAFRPSGSTRDLVIAVYEAPARAAREVPGVGYSSVPAISAIMLSGNSGNGRLPAARHSPTVASADAVRSSSRPGSRPR